MYIRLRQRWLLPILIVIWGPVPAAGSPLQSFVEASRTLSGQFEQVLFDARDSVQERSTGAFWLQRPGQFRWEYRSPYPQTLLSDGERLWLYDPDLAQVTVRPLAEALASAPAALLTGEGLVAQAFAVERLRENGAVTWYALTPRSDAGDFRRVELALEDNVPVQVILYDNFDQRTVITFSRLQVNQPLPSSRFEFEAPPGVEVVEG